MTNITIQIKGLDELRKNIDNLDVKRIFVDAANRSIARVQMYATAEVPVKTSQLQKSHLLRPATQRTLSAEVYTEKEYAVPVHEGHRIIAWGNDTGRFQPPNPWMERAAGRAENEINSFFNEAADRVAGSIVK